MEILLEGMTDKVKRQEEGRVWSTKTSNRVCGDDQICRN